MDEETSAFLDSGFDESPSSNMQEIPSDCANASSGNRSSGTAQTSGTFPLQQPAMRDVALYSHQQEEDPKQIEVFGNSEFLNLDWLPMDFDFGLMWDWDLGQEYQQLDPPEVAATINEGISLSIQRNKSKCSIETKPAIAPKIAPINHQSPATVRHGYSINQTDPVEAKCAAIRSLLQDSEPLVTKDMISANITREKLLLCIQLYGKHFQRNYPILHSPTFTLIDTSPFLLLAMMLTGACYSDGLISNAHITKFAMRLLILIGKLPHEIDMQTPSLSTIQASVIICGTLVCSRNEIAYKFASVHFARNISMADRAGVFDEMPSVDYSMMTDDMFDWSLWVEQESRRRIACEILSQDMAACVFHGKSPSLSPLTLKVELPCYEACWEAQTSPECFQMLQKFPPQIQVSTASRYLRTPLLSVDKVPLFEASAFGMSTLIMGLHGLLFQTLQEDIDPDFGNAPMPFSMQNAHASPNESVQLNRLKQDFSGASIALYADAAVSKYGSFAVKRVNAVLNAWHATWEYRHVRDYEHENITFKGDPIQFWWLAKLLLIVHMHGRAIDEDSELAIPSPNAGDEKGKTTLQTKLVKWLARLRRHGKEADLPDEDNVISTLMKPR